MAKLSPTPLVDHTADIEECDLGRYTEIAARSSLGETRLGDYSYVMQDCRIWRAEIGKFVNIAASVRINATNHPTWRATQHHFTYRAGDYFDGEADEESFFDWRRSNAVTIGHDVWIGHGATILPGVSIGNGAVIGSGAVVTKTVEAYRIVGGVPAKLIRRRFSCELGEKMDALSWWDWPHETLRTALHDFRNLSADAFVEKYLGS